MGNEDAGEMEKISETSQGNVLGFFSNPLAPGTVRKKIYCSIENYLDDVRNKNPGLFEILNIITTRNKYQ